MAEVIVYTWFIVAMVWYMVNSSGGDRLSTLHILAILFWPLYILLLVMVIISAFIIEMVKDK